MKTKDFTAIVDHLRQTLPPTVDRETAIALVLETVNECMDEFNCALTVMGEHMELLRQQTEGMMALLRQPAVQSPVPHPGNSTQH